MSAHAHQAKGIAPGAYDALVDALAVIFWNKQPFERFVRFTLRDHPDVLAGIDFTGLKRQAAADLVMRLASDSEPAVRAHSNKGGGLIFMEGTDLYAVLDEQVSLVAALEAKRRHLSETGLPLLLVSEMLRRG